MSLPLAIKNLRLNNFSSNNLDAHDSNDYGSDTLNIPGSCSAEHESMGISEVGSNSFNPLFAGPYTGHR